LPTDLTEEVAIAAADGPLDILPTPREPSAPKVTAVMTVYLRVLHAFTVSGALFFANEGLVNVGNETVPLH